MIGTAVEPSTHYWCSQYQFRTNQLAGCTMRSATRSHSDTFLDTQDVAARVSPPTRPLRNLRSECLPYDRYPQLRDGEWLQLFATCGEYGCGQCFRRVEAGRQSPY